MCFDKNTSGYFKGGSFKGDVASANGGDVYVETGACVTFTEVNFRMSFANKGGAVYANTNGSVDVGYSFFDRNAATVRHPTFCKTFDVIRLCLVLFPKYLSALLGMKDEVLLEMNNERNRTFYNMETQKA